MSDEGFNNRASEEETVDEFPPVDISQEETVDEIPPININEIDKTMIGADSGAEKSGNQPVGPSADKAAAWIGRQLGKYQITGLLGQGGMGVVYQAHDSTIERDVAIKLLPAELASDKKMLDRFLAEAKAAGRLTHPHVVSIHEISQEGDVYFIVMELMTGGSADDHLESIGPYSPLEATRIIADACEGLMVAHTSGLVHRDIKPGNLLQSKHGTIKVADFGLAKRVIQQSQQLTQDGQLIGTPYFMSPEQCESKTVDNRSDIYSLGATYYTLLTGDHPYEDAGSIVQIMYAHCHADVLDPRDVDSKIPDKCAAIIQKAMAKKPDDRYQTAEEMLTDLKAVETQSERYGDTKVLNQDELKDVSKRKNETSHLQGKIFNAVIFTVTFLLLTLVPYYFWTNREQHETTGQPSKASPANQPLAQGITADKIILGTSTAMTGANKELGSNMVMGMQACFKSVNASGGIGGRNLELIVKDDGYEPDQAHKNMHQLFEGDKVFAVIGNVGTPTAEVTVPYANENKYLFFAPLTGARSLRRDPPDRYVFNLRASYADETEAMVHYFVEKKRVSPDKIAVFAQNDSFGDDGFAGVAKALEKYKIQPENILRVGYDRNTTQITEAVKTIEQNQDRVEALIMVATFKPAALMVQQIKDRKLNIQVAAVSFVGSELLAQQFKEMGADYAEDVIVTQVVPYYLSSASGVLRYRAAMKKFYPLSKPGFVSLEGFLAAECFVEGLKKTVSSGEALTTENVIDSLEQIKNLDLGIGPIINFGPSRHQASNRVWGTILDKKAQYKELEMQ
ncbi:ABC transporter substrate-binding protein [Gimesia fumaroli]|uniref:non-specific serine/threonine protein kinase n=1 Tax=Gimesia fumaroli TaxID=2527976 RepID=A0A518I9G3_9PLAN|nr:ABC transporter substrate-binding protein [Gimesia fumaroli]QDV49748.1 Serine/threonine-protein kinase PknB [Gimesia fumaroli]